MPEYEVVHHDDSDSDVSAPSLDNEFGVPMIRTPGVKKALTSANEKLRRSSQAKNPVTRYAYIEYMAHHYAFTMKVVAEQEPKRPSLRHRLEGEKKPNYTIRGKEGRTTQNRAKAVNEACKGREPRKAMQSRRKPRKPIYRAKPWKATQADLPRKIAESHACRSTTTFLVCFLKGYTLATY